MKGQTMSGWRRNKSKTGQAVRSEWPRTLALAVVAALVLSGALRAEQVDVWRSLIHAEHLAAVEQAPARAKAVLAQLGSDDYGYTELDQVRALLDAETSARPADRLLGKWRCRSIQINDYGIFSYPPFRCQIRQVEGEWDFRKLSGSQRRSGSLYLDSPGNWVFLGGSHVNDDPPRHYSGFEGSIQSQPSDSVGTLQTLADGQLRMLLDADSGSFELYLLER